MTLRLRPTEYCNKLEKKMIEQKSVRKPDNELKEAWAIIMRGIDMINAMEEDQTRIMDHDLDEIFILSELSDMIYPEVIRWDSTSRRTKDLSIRQDPTPAGSEVNFTQFMMAQALVRAAYRRDENESMVPISTLRIKRNLSEVIDRVVYCKFGENNEIVDRLVCQPKGSVFYPIFIQQGPVHALFDETYFMDRYTDILDDLVISKSFK